MLKPFITKNFLAKQRLGEEILYEKVSNELSMGYIRDGLWLKAIEKANGSESAVKSIYIKLRVQSLKDEISLHNEIEEATSYPDTVFISNSNQEATRHRELLSLEDKKPIPFVLTSVKSFVMENDLVNVKEVCESNPIDLGKNLAELIELADLFGSKETKEYLIEKIASLNL